MIVDRYDVQLSDSAVCHRNQTWATRSASSFPPTDGRQLRHRLRVLHQHRPQLVDLVGVSQEFSDLVWKQVDDKARGETSLDAYELRKVATTTVPRREGQA